MTTRYLKMTALLLAAVALSGLRAAVSLGAGPPAGTAAAAGTENGAAGQPAASEVLARVNGAAITRAEVERAVQIFLVQSRASHDLTPEARKEAENAALEQLIGTKLLYQDGLRLNIENLERLVAEKVARAKEKFPSASAYDSALKTNNLSEAEAQQIVRNDIVVTTLLRSKVVDKITVPEQELRNFYRQNLEKFSTPATVRISHILIGTGPEATAQEKIKARGQAEALRERLLAGEDFAALAKTESSCPSKVEGGDLGAFGKEELIPEFAAAITGLKPGEISPVVETSFGFHLLRLVARNGTAVATFEEARGKIESYLKQTRTQQAIVDYVSQLKKKAVIVKNS